MAGPKPKVSYPKVGISRVYLKPLTGGRLGAYDASKVLKNLKRDLLKRIRQKIQGQAFSLRAKAALSKSLRVKVSPSSLTVTTSHPAFRPLVKGRKPRQMKWLTKAKAPIPMYTDKGELIFRTATPKAMSRGAWYHPGHESTNLLEMAKKEARELVKKRLRADLLRDLKGMFK